MQFSYLLTALTAAGLATATPVTPATSLNKRGCFTSGGENWGAEKTYALQHAFEVCRDFFTGSYNPGDIRAHCYNLSSAKKVDFVLQLKSSVAAKNIDPTECYDGLQKEINGCDQGGHTEYTNWIYTSDPNAGNC